MKSVREIIPKKTETHRTKLTAGVNLIYYPGEVSMPTSDLTTKKLHVHMTMSDIKSRYMCMDHFFSS